MLILYAGFTHKVLIMPTNLVCFIWQTYTNLMTQHSYLRDFPGGPVVKNLPSTSGDPGSIPGQGMEVPNATGQPSPCGYNY